MCAGCLDRLSSFRRFRRLDGATVRYPFAALVGLALTVPVLEGGGPESFASRPMANAVNGKAKYESGRVLLQPGNAIGDARNR